MNVAAMAAPATAARPDEQRGGRCPARLLRDEGGDQERRRGRCADERVTERRGRHHDHDDDDDECVHSSSSGSSTNRPDSMPDTITVPLGKNGNVFHAPSK